VRLLPLAMLALAGVALGDDAQAPVLTCTMLVIGWDAETHAILSTRSLSYVDRWTCEEARDSQTPDSTRVVRFMSVCISPTDIGT